MIQKTWITQGFDAFRRGTFGNGGQNLYVSQKGVLQRIYQYDLDRNGYIDLVYANCQNHSESAPTYVYTLDGQKQELSAQGCLSGITVDLDGDGYEEIIMPGFYDVAAPYASTDIYWGTKEGYSESYRTRIPTPHTDDCCYGDFNGKGKPTLVFAMAFYESVRIFEQTELNCPEWDQYKDLNLGFACKLITAADLDGDGYDDLIARAADTTETVIYWGGPDGLNVERKTILPQLPAQEILLPEEEKIIQSDFERKQPTARLLETVRWNGRNCFTLSTGKKMIFFSGNTDRQIERVLEIDVPMALSVAVGDIDGDGYDDIAIACTARNEVNPEVQKSFIIWNSPNGLDIRPRTTIDTKSACDVSILDRHVLFCQSNVGCMYTNDSLLFTCPDFTTPMKFQGEDPRRCALIKNSDGVLRVALINHFSRCAYGTDDNYVYWGSKDGYSPDNRLIVPGHCAVDAMIADFNDDGWAELLIANNSENSVHLDVGHHMHYFGPNGFEPQKSHTIETNVGWGVTAGDFDHDGYLEIATPGNNWKELRIYSARDQFRSYQTIELPENSSGRWPVAVDINKDGWLDLIVPCLTHNCVIFWGGPEGFSLERSKELATYMSVGVTAADLTQNGWPDIIVGGHIDVPTKGSLKPHEPHNSFIYIYWNGPEGISENRKCVLRGDAADSFAIADFNNDGWLDIFAGCYHNGKERDINSFLYWNREGKFSELDRDLLYTHSASGCMAADFNEDGYIDVAVANHKVYGDHRGYSSVWWNGPEGFRSDKCTNLPTDGPHGMISTDIGNILDRSNSEYYYSEKYMAENDCIVTKAYIEGDVPPKTSVSILLRVNDGAWVPAQNLRLRKGDVLEYRLELYAYNCLRTPRIEKVVLEFA